MNDENLIGKLIDVRIVSVQGYGLVLENDSIQIIVLAPDAACFAVHGTRYEVGQLESVRILRRNSQTGQYVGRIEEAKIN